MISRLALWYACGAVALAVVIAGSNAASADEDLPDVTVPTGDHPIPGWRYELSYRSDTGEVTGLVAGDPSGPPFYGATGQPSLIVEAGQAVMDVTEHTQLKLILADIESFVVDLDTGRVVPTDASQTRLGASDSPLSAAEDYAPVMALLGVGLLLVAVRVRQR